jgi:hypothetical protein
MRILHVATDEKFLDHAYPVFERAFPNSNDVVVFAPRLPLRYVKLVPNRVEVICRDSFKWMPSISTGVYRKYDLVVFHSLQKAFFRLLSSLPSDVPAVWLGWGGDYYPEMFYEGTLLLRETRLLKRRLEGLNFRGRFGPIIKRLQYRFPLMNRKIMAVERMSVFAPVLPEEYLMLKQSRKWKAFPRSAVWNYGTIEDNFTRGVEGEVVTGNAILVGNSASYTCNHLDALELLVNLQVRDRKIIVPLSYGDPEVAKAVASHGRKKGFQEFIPLVDFLAVDDYVKIIKECGFVIMNQKRQQAVGNVVIMLYLGARVFLRRENPLCGFLRSAGVNISTVQELERKPGLLSTPLSKLERSMNRKFVCDYWSRETAHKRTKELVFNALLDSKNHANPRPPDL